MKRYVRAADTGYWEAIMRYFDNGRQQEYRAFTTGYNEDEAISNLCNIDLLGDEKSDQIFSIYPISEEEYYAGSNRYHSGERWR